MIKDMANAETKIQNDILIALSTYPDMIVWRSAVGNGWVRTGDGFKPMRFGGIPGQSDIIGCWQGRFIGIEVKTATGKLSKEQRQWGAAIVSCGGIYIVARSVEDALNGLHKSQASHMVIDVGSAHAGPVSAPTTAVARVLHPLDATAVSSSKNNAEE